MLKPFLSFLLLTGISCFSAKAQEKPIAVVDTLNKRIPITLVKVVLETLQYYPELDEVSIDFVFFDGMHNSFMQAKPRPLSLLKGRAQREYKIQMMSSMMINDSIVLIHELPKDALIGWFGHEIAHIIDYESMSVGDIVIFSLRYVFSKTYVIRTEARVDMIAIDHGLGENNIAWKNFVRDQISLPKAYRKKVDGMYMPEEEVRKAMHGE